MIPAALVLLITLSGALLAVTQKSIVRAIFGLGVALAGVALAFLLLNAPFVAAMQVLIYIGGITVAMAFGVMLSSAGRDEPAEGIARRVGAGLVAALLFIAVAAVIVRTDFPTGPAPDPESWSVAQIGRELLDRFNVVFELLSVVLLVAIIGAITIAARRDDSPDPTSPEEGRP